MQVVFTDKRKQIEACAVVDSVMKRRPQADAVFHRRVRFAGCPRYGRTIGAVCGTVPVTDRHHFSAVQPGGNA